MPSVFVFPHRGKSDPQSLRTKEAALEAFLRTIESQPGPPGPPGPPGEDGADGGTASYTHVQGTPATTWTINHPLGFRPNIVVVDETGEQVEGEVDYTDADTITVKFSAAFSGNAYLS